MSDSGPVQQPLRTILTIWLSIGLVLGFVWLLAYYPSNPTDGAFSDRCKTVAHTERNATGDNQNPDTLSPRIIQSEPEIYDYHRDAEEERRANERRLSEYTCELAVYTAQLATFTKLLVIVTVAVAAVGIYQGMQPNRHAGHLEGTAQAAQASAEAAKAANELTNKIFVAGQRPWVSIQNLTIIDDGRNLKIDVMLGNSGRSPASNVYVGLIPMREGERGMDAIIRGLSADRVLRQAVTITIFPEEDRTYTAHMRIDVNAFIHNPALVLVEYQFAAATSDHITVRTVFCTRVGPQINVQWLNISDFAT